MSDPFAALAMRAMESQEFDDTGEIAGGAGEGSPTESEDESENIADQDWSEEKIRVMVMEKGEEVEMEKFDTVLL